MFISQPIFFFFLSVETRIVYVAVSGGVEREVENRAIFPPTLHGQGGGNTSVCATQTLDDAFASKQQTVCLANEIATLTESNQLHTHMPLTHSDRGRERRVLFAQILVICTNQLGRVRPTLCGR